MQFAVSIGSILATVAGGAIGGAIAGGIGTALNNRRQANVNANYNANSFKLNNFANKSIMLNKPSSFKGFSTPIIKK